MVLDIEEINMDRKTMDSAMEGLMLLGRTKEEAIKEILDNERRQQDEAHADWWKNGDKMFGNSQ